MQAYNYSDLYNNYVEAQASDALQTGCIQKESFVKIKEAYPVMLYTPNYFIRIALGLLTIVAVVFSGLLLWLISSASEESSIITLLVILAVFCYAVLEVFVQKKKYYNAGVDNILMAMILVFVISSFLVTGNISWIIISGITMLITLYLCTRFADSFMGVVSYFSSFIFVFLIYVKFGNIARATAPLLMMIVSAVAYFLVNKLSSKTILYKFCCETVILITLITFYASGNYFVVKELSNEMFSLNLALHDPIPLAWLFWSFIFLIPPAYLFYGIKHKSFLFIRTGLGLIAATIFTIKYYYTVLPVEIEMLIGGIVLIGVSYLLIKYLAMPRHGYTSANLFPHKKEMLNLEALIIAETFNEQPAAAPQNTGLYGGGSGGGGGATGEF
jgi:hypothetical protein